MPSTTTFDFATQKHCRTCVTHLPKNDDAVYCEVCETRPVHLGYTDAELHAAFARVEDKTHWKNPIHATVYPAMNQEERKIFSAAIGFFTGENPKFIDAPNKTTVIGRGYYVVIGA